MIQFLFPTVATLSFGPALLLFYLALSGYTYPKSEKVYFDDRWIFTLLAVGIVLGALLLYFETALLSGGFGLILLLLIIEELIMLVILNFPRFRAKGGSRFYGYALGTSTAAGMAIGEYWFVFGRANAIDPFTLLILLIYTFGLELVGGSSGSFIGYSIEMKSIPGGVFAAVAVQAVYNFLLIPVFSFRPSALTFSFDLAALLIATLSFLYVHYRIFPSVRAVEAQRRRLI